MKIVNSNGFDACRNRKAFITTLGMCMALITAMMRYFPTFS